MRERIFRPVRWFRSSDRELVNDWCDTSPESFRREQGPSRPLNAAVSKRGLQARASFRLKMQWHGVQWPDNGRTERIHSRRRSEPPSYRVVLDIHDTVDELLFRHDLRLVEAAHPHVQLTFQPKRKAALDKLHGLFKRNFWSGRDQGMKVFWHDDECVQEESSLVAIFEDGSLKELRVGRHLKKAAALRRYCGHEVGARFLRCQSHMRSISERPAAKAGSIASLLSGA